MREVTKGQGFICNDEAEKIEIFTKLEKLGYPIFKGSFYNGNLGVNTYSGALGIFFNGEYFSGNTATHIKEKINKEEFFNEVLIASQEWKPYATPKPMLVDDITDGVFDLEHPVLGEYEGHFIDKNFEKWTFAREIPTPKYTHEKLVEFVGHEFIHVK